MKQKNTKIKTAISAHNGFTAKIVSSHGFDYIWASSLEISCSRAVPDASIVSFQHIKDIVENIVESSSVPVIVDCDTGYGNAVNVHYYFKDLKKIGVKGVCIEDNIFPKQNSFYKGLRPIEKTEEFVKKLKIAKEIFNSNDEFVIARTEALIQGYGQSEALFRAKEYYLAGADYIMPHSKQKTPEELFEFSENWDHTVPLVSVPSTYPNVHINELQEKGVGIVIYANHTIRAIKHALDQILPNILKDGGTHNIEDKISPLKEILELSGEETVKEIERKIK